MNKNFGDSECIRNFAIALYTLLIAVLPQGVSYFRFRAEATVCEFPVLTCQVIEPRR